MSNCTNNFIKRVIGVTRTFNWTITTNGAAVPLVAEDLTLQLVPPRGEAVSLPFDVDDNIVSFTWQGEDQHIIGCYSLILWANYGEDNQRRVDIHNFVELIPWSDRQSGEYSDLVEESIELETADFGENIMVVDNLNSTSATDALSANMGRQLNVTKQDVIADLATIRSGAAAGAAVKEWAKNDPLITDDATQVSASKLAFNGNIFEQWVPGIASSIGLKGIAGFLKLADISQWDSAYNDRMLPTVAAVKAKLQAVLTALATIEAVIPSQASSTNKLTDKGYVDGAIATNTANFVGTFDTLAELQAVQNPTKNDYGFVIEQDAQGNEYYDRYKYTGTQWLYEYKVESTPFTTEQWAAIQSGITAALVSKLSALPTNAELNTALASKQPVINDLDTIRAGAAAGATAYQKPSGGIPKTDLASAVQTSLGKADSAYQKPSGGIPASDMASAVQTSLGKADAAAPQSTTYTKAEVDAALALKQTSSQLATINGSRIDQGGNVSIVAVEGQTITIDATPTAGSNNAVSSGGVYNELYDTETITTDITIDSSGGYAKAYFDEPIPEGTLIQSITFSGSMDTFYWVKLDNNLDTSALVRGSSFPMTLAYGVKGVASNRVGSCTFHIPTDVPINKIDTITATLESAVTNLEDITESVSNTKDSDLLRKSINLFDGVFTIGGYWNNGTYITTPIYSHNAHPIPISVGIALQSTYKDSNGNRTYLGGFIQEFSDLEGTQPIIRENAITGNSYRCTDANVKSIIFCFRTDVLQIDVNTMEWMIYDWDSELVRVYKPYNTSSWPIYMPYGYENELDAEKKKTLTGLYGKQVVCFGDSLTQMGFYPLYAQMLVGGTFYNCGVGGTWLTRRPTADGYEAFSAEAIATAIAEEDWSVQETAAQTLTQYADTVARMSSIDYSSVDIVSFAFGTNDWNNTNHVEGSNSLDNFETLTYRGAVNYICKKIHSKYPNIKIIFICPIYRVFVGANLEEYHNSTYETEGFTDSDVKLNQASITLRQVVEYIKEQAALNHCGCLDMYDNFGCNRYNYLEYLYDGTHPTYDGYRELGRRLAGFLLSK